MKKEKNPSSPKGRESARSGKKRRISPHDEKGKKTTYEFFGTQAKRGGMNYYSTF